MKKKILLLLLPAALTSFVFFFFMQFYASICSVGWPWTAVGAIEGWGAKHVEIALYLHRCSIAVVVIIVLVDAKKKKRNSQCILWLSHILHLIHSFV